MNGMVMTSVLIDAEIDKSGGALVDPDLFLTIISTMEHGNIDIKRQKNKLVLTQNGKDRTISVEELDQFPNDPTVSEQTVFETSLSYMLSVTKTIGFAVSQTRDRPILQGIYMSKGSMIAGDGERLASVPLHGSDKETVLASIVCELFNSLAAYGIQDEITMTYGDRGWLKIDGMGIQIWIARLAGEYPSTAETLIETYKKNTSSTKIVVDKNDVIPALQLANAYSNIAITHQEPHYVVLSIDDEGLLFNLDTSNGSMEDRVTCKELSGKPCTIMVHPAHLLEAVQTAPYDELTIKISEPFKPLVMLSGEWTMIQTPMGDQKTAEQWEANRIKEKEKEDDF
jgi:DNA polymerase III sliding clamp (beta) subunit (PCNA family)